MVNETSTPAASRFGTVNGYFGAGNALRYRTRSANRPKIFAVHAFRHFSFWRQNGPIRLELKVSIIGMNANLPL
jgi:hypothetical protein